MAFLFVVYCLVCFFLAGCLVQLFMFFGWFVVSVIWLVDTVHGLVSQFVYLAVHSIVH